MLFPGNAKLGKHLIWSFALPSGKARVCVGMTATCRQVCYARKLEAYRPTAAKSYAINLQRSRRRGFVKRIRALLIANHVRVLRIHSGGEFHSAHYAKKWLTIIRRTPKVRFFTYTRCWRVPAIFDVLVEMARLPNLQLWFSADRETGLPATVTEGVRVAWLMTSPEDTPPRGVDLVFRVPSLRRTPLTVIDSSPVCPAENGLERSSPMTCHVCRTCWRPADLSLRPSDSRQPTLLPLAEVPC